MNELDNLGLRYSDPDTNEIGWVTPKFEEEYVTAAASVKVKELNA